MSHSRLFAEPLEQCSKVYFSFSKTLARGLKHKIAAPSVGSLGKDPGTAVLDVYDRTI